MWIPPSSDNPVFLKNLGLADAAVGSISHPTRNSAGQVRWCQHAANRKKGRRPRCGTSGAQLRCYCPDLHLSTKVSLPLISTPSTVLQDGEGANARNEFNTECITHFLLHIFPLSILQFEKSEGHTRLPQLIRRLQMHAVALFT